MVAASLERALQLAQNGLDLIGENELLHATKGAAYVVQVVFGIKPDDTCVEKAARCAERVFAINPQSRHGFRLRAMIHYQRGERAQEEPLPLGQLATTDLRIQFPLVIKFSAVTNSFQGTGLP